MLELVKGLNETATKAVEISPSVKRLSVTVGIEDEESGNKDSVTMIRLMVLSMAHFHTEGKIVGANSGSAIGEYNSLYSYLKYIPQDSIIRRDAA